MTKLFVQCPFCKTDMVKCKDKLNRWFALCVRCGINIPLENGFREIKVKED